MTRYEGVQARLRANTRSWLVTGAAGFIGSNLIEALLKLDQRVVGLDNFSSGNRGNLAQVKDAVSQAQWRSFRFIEGDVRAPGTRRLACRSVEVVLHQAAIGSVPQTIADPVSTHETNVTGLRRSVQNQLSRAEAALSDS